MRRQEDLGDRQRGVQGGLLPGEGGGGPVQGGGRGLHLEKKEGVRESSLDTSDPREVTMVVSREMRSCLATRLEGCTTKLSEEREKEGWAIRSLGPGGLIRGGGGGGGGREGGGEGGSGGGVSMRTFKLELGHSLGHERF